MIKRKLKKLVDYLFGEYLAELKLINRRLLAIQAQLKQEEMQRLVRGETVAPLGPISGIKVFPGGE